MASPSSSLLSLLLCIFYISYTCHDVSACSLLECPNGTVLANTPPTDTSFMLTFPVNESCSNVSLPLRCSGCASCDSRFILEWADSDSYNCSVDELYSKAPPGLESIACSRLVFGDLSQGQGSHCGWDEASGRGICRYADSNLMGGTRVCRYTDVNEDFVTETSIILRRVENECVPVPSPVPSIAPSADKALDSDMDLITESPTLEVPQNLTSGAKRDTTFLSHLFLVSLVYCLVLVYRDMKR